MYSSLINNEAHVEGPHNEFKQFDAPNPRRGLTSVEGAAFLRQQFPQVPTWVIWSMHHQPYCMDLARLVTIASADRGQIGRDWSWTRVPVPYPQPLYWDGQTINQPTSTLWVGVLQIQNLAGEKFLLGSFLSSAGAIGANYYTSTTDVALLDRFAQAVHRHNKPESPHQIYIHVEGGAPVMIEHEEAQPLILSPKLLTDIEGQVTAFFTGAAAYQRMQLRHRRGFLLVGPPGNGKTMLLRHLVRLAHLRHQADVAMLAITYDTDAHSIRQLFDYAATHAPCLVLLEDMDSLTRECQVTRASLLQHLDGLGTVDGVLIIGTTNNPGDIDPALVHRPSRFDRVWHIELPSEGLRLRYLKLAFPDLEEEAREWIAGETEGWSFAYLNELRTTAAILAIKSQLQDITPAMVEEALELLEAQFRAGRKNHVEAEVDSEMGFTSR